MRGMQQQQMSVNFGVDSVHCYKKLLGIVGEMMRSFYFFSPYICNTRYNTGGASI